MVLSGSQVKKILIKINDAVINPTTNHPLDERELETYSRIFLSRA